MGDLKEVTLGEVEDVRYLREIEGLKIKDIAKILNVSTMRVRYICHKFIKYKVKRSYSEAEIKEIVNMFKKGYTKEQIGRKFNRTIVALNAVLRNELGTSRAVNLVRARGRRP